MLEEFRYALRSVRRAPGFSFVAIATLALGIGANTALFSLVYGILLRPLDFGNSERLIAFRVDRAFAGRADRVPANFSVPDLDVWQKQSRSFESIAMLGGWNALVTTPAGNEVLATAIVTPTFFSTVDGRVLIGRDLDPSDDGSPSVVISARLWHRAFASDPGVLGRTVVIDRQPHSVIGVVDATFQLPSPRTDVWRPLGFARTQNASLAQPRGGGFQVFGRLRPGVPLEQAQADADAVTRAIDPALHAQAIPLREWFLTPTVRTTLLALLSAVGLVLLVACANVTNLVLARNASRTRELTVRLALGATRRRLLLQSLAYSGVIAASGTTAGAILAAAIVRGLIVLEPAGIPRLDAVRVDYPILIFAALLAGCCTLIVAALPAFQSFRARTVLRTGSAPAGRNIRRVLVVAEVTVSVVLLVGASLLGRSFMELMRTDLGITREPVTAALIDASFGRQLSMAEQHQLIERIVERVGRLPGVTSIGAGAAMPPNLARLRFTMPRFNDASGTQTNYMVDAVTATPGYFTTLGIRLQSGRLFEDGDAMGSPEVMIVSASTARQFFGTRDPIGRAVPLPILTGQPGRMASAPVTVVGVVDDVKYSGIERPADAVIYRPFAQQPWPSLYIVMRTAASAPGLASAVRRELAAVDPGIGVQAIDTLDGLIANAVAQPRFRAMVLIGLATLAIALAAIGLYGVVSYTAAQRTTEIGIRMAVGADQRDVIRLVLREGLVMAAAGIVAGAIAARALTGTIVSLLYGIQPTDTVSYVGGAALLMILTMVASYVPARRASRIDPLAALRQD